MNSGKVLLGIAACGGLLGLWTPGFAQTPSTDLLTVVALNTQLLQESERAGLREDEAMEVAAVAELICEVHSDRPPCGSYCTSDRRDRAHIRDYSATVVRDVDCWDTARILVSGAHDYGVPLDEVLATAYQESHFRQYALGSGSECGLFQQTTHRIRWSSEEVEGMGRLPFVGSQEICQYLLRPENAMWHFALKYHHEQAQSGDDWPAYYNGGVNMWGYQQRHESYRQRFAAFLDDYVPAEGTDEVLEAGN